MSEQNEPNEPNEPIESSEPDKPGKPSESSTGKPAATIGDWHFCPKTTGNVPHIGGAAITGSPNVFIGGKPALRVGDILVCVGPPDEVTGGSRSVFINGERAARMGDATKHGGGITTGNSSVIIGDAPWRGPNEDTLPIAPATKAEVSDRMKQASEKLQTARANGQPLPPPAYTSMDKLFIAVIGLDERFLLRLVESKHAKDDDHIGYRPKGAATCTYWTTAYTQLEHAGTDPELLCNAVGKTYDPTADYTLLLIDQEAANKQGDMLSFMPTYENLSEFSEREISKEFKGNAHLIAPAMTEEFSRHYEQLFNRASAEGIKLDKKEEFNELAQYLGFSPEQTEILQVRHKLKDKLGANEQFLGNGMTRDNSFNYTETPFGQPTPDKHYGPAETFTYDKNPRTLWELEHVHHVVTRIPLKKTQG